MEIQNQITPKSQGGKNNNRYSVVVASNKEAERIFNKVAMRLLSANYWGKLIEKETTEVHLYDKDGNSVNRLIKKNDFFRISYPGSYDFTGQVYDWVKVENIETYTDHSIEMELFSIITRPALNPLSCHPDTLSHYSNDSSSAFIVKRESDKLTAEIHLQSGETQTPDACETDIEQMKPDYSAVINSFSGMKWKKLDIGLFS